MQTGFFDYLAALLMTGVALWRAPAALRWGDTQRRALCACYAGYAAALWPKTPIVADWLSHIPVTDLAVLLEHYAGSAAVMCIIIYVAAGYGRIDDSAPRPVVLTVRLARVAPATAAVFALGLTAAFLTLVDRSHSTSDFVAEHVGQPGAAAYLTIFYVWLGSSCLVCGYQWASAARLSSSRPLRVGLAVLATAMVLGSVYIVIRVIYMWGAVAFPSLRAYGSSVAHITAGIQLVMFITFAAGCSIPTSNVAAGRWTSSRLLKDLKTLHHDLIACFPDVAFEGSLRRRSALASVPVLRKFFDWSMPIDVRLGFRIHAIADAMEQLRHYAPPDLFEHAEDYAATMEEELPEEERPNPQAVAEAIYIRAALAGFALGTYRATPSDPLPRKPHVSVEAEARWWRQVQAQYTAITPAEAWSLLLTAAAEA
ncbi:MAB_1171c family putative transporter [Streptomyces sp. NPDC047049]|uniref:MAB_1171c family putative transporter n=1 Tax=Streptomyces sp. NPDC047049 TaxID=3156688 RepID=UPI0033DA8590